jgi:large subunit ribosomal protein L29
MKTSEIEGLTIKEIVERIDNEKIFLIRQKLNHAISPLDNPMKIRETKRTIARLSTILKKKKEEGVKGEMEIEEENEVKEATEAKEENEVKEATEKKEEKEVKEKKRTNN